jgi:hypothetical protein
MATDVILDHDNGTSIVLQAAALKATATDFLLDSPLRHTGGQIKRTAGFRRALVHDFEDGLTVNFNGDYPGGVTINGSIITLNTLTQDSPGAGDVRFTFRHPPELDQDGNPRIDGFNETVLLGELLSNLRDEISALKARVASLEGK